MVSKILKREIKLKTFLKAYKIDKLMSRTTDKKVDTNNKKEKGNTVIKTTEIFNNLKRLLQTTLCQEL